jgi:hypothetical protein
MDPFELKSKNFVKMFEKTPMGAKKYYANQNNNCYSDI